MLVVAALLLGCGGSTQSTGGDEPLINDSLMTPEERAYAEAAKPFMEALLQKKYDAAYQFLSKDARDELSQDAFVDMLDKYASELGTPVSLNSVYGVYTMKELAEEEADDDGSDALIISDVLGPTPDAIRSDLRRASVKGQIGLGQDEEGNELGCILTVVLVDERGQNKVGWFWFRQFSIWD
jgi:hypothetical protein